VPDEGTLVIRLQSTADTPVNCRVSTPFRFTRAFRTTFLGLAPSELPVLPDGAVSVEVPAFGTAAFTLQLGPTAPALSVRAER